VEVEGSIIYPSNVIELLGLKYDRRLSTLPHVKALLAAVRQRASVVARLANYLPRGVTEAAVIWPGHRQVLTRAGGRGTAEAGARGQRVCGLERDPGGLERRCLEYRIKCLCLNCPMAWAWAWPRGRGRPDVGVVVAVAVAFAADDMDRGGWGERGGES
jgi:hypothetical protein